MMLEVMMKMKMMMNEGNHRDIEKKITRKRIYRDILFAFH